VTGEERREETSKGGKGVSNTRVGQKKKRVSNAGESAPQGITKGGEKVGPIWGSVNGGRGAN